MHDTTASGSASVKFGAIEAAPSLPVQPPSIAPGILLSSAELAALPTSGAGWTALLARANSRSGDAAVITNRGQHNIDVLANAFVGARLNDNARKAYVRDELRNITQNGRDNNDVLGTLRNLQTYVIAADIINLSTFDPAFNAQFRNWLDIERKHDYAGGGGGGSVISTHNKKPNNFGTHAGSSRITAALYLGDTADFQAAARVWQYWATGDPALKPATYYYEPTNWYFDQNRKAGINPKGASRDGHSLDGVIPADQRRCGEYSWPPCATNYIHGAADGMLLSFYMLSRKGYDAWNWGDKAALRQYQWKYAVNQPPYGEFKWQVPIVNKAYGTNFAGTDPGATGKSFAFAAWWVQ